MVGDPQPRWGACRRSQRGAEQIHLGIVLGDIAHWAESPQSHCQTVGGFLIRTQVSDGYVVSLIQIDYPTRRIQHQADWPGSSGFPLNVPLERVELRVGFI